MGRASIESPRFSITMQNPYHDQNEKQQYVYSVALRLDLDHQHILTNLTPFLSLFHYRNIVAL